MNAVEIISHERRIKRYDFARQMRQYGSADTFLIMCTLQFTAFQKLYWRVWSYGEKGGVI